MNDFRRAIRLGRLLRQEDVVVISDLVGLASIHVGARGVYRRALADGDLELALLASAALGEVAPQRLRTSERITRTDLADSLRDDGRGGYDLVLRPGKIDALIEARLLTAGGDEQATVTLAHEALLREWPRTAEWVRANREHLRIRSRIEQALKRWESKGRNDSLLLPEGLEMEEGLRQALLQLFGQRGFPRAGNAIEEYDLSWIHDLLPSTEMCNA